MINFRKCDICFMTLRKKWGAKCFLAKSQIFLTKNAGVRIWNALHLPTTAQNLNAFISTNNLKSNQSDMLHSLNAECKENGFEIWISKELQ